MGRERLQQLAEDFASAKPWEYEELAQTCRELAINELDVRFMVLGECFEISREFWGEGESGAVSQDFAAALRQRWAAYLGGVLRSPHQDEGTALAVALRDELRSLMVVDPLTFKFDLPS